MAKYKTFKVRGPFAVPVEALGAGRVIADDLGPFWDEAAEIADARGCYVFAMRAGQGIVPWYVGKATKSFRQEVFADHKVAKKYTRVLAQYLKGTPVVFFVVHPAGKGAVNRSMIGAIESYLISVAWNKNEELLNIQLLPEYDWSIHGVIRSGKGHPSSDAKQLSACLGL